MTEAERTALTEVFGLMAKLVDLERQKIETMRQLRKAYALALLLDVHPKGMGRVHHHVREGRYGFRPWVDATLIVGYEGREHHFPLEHVDPVLWPDDLRARYERSQKARTC